MKKGRPIEYQSPRKPCLINFDYVVYETLQEIAEAKNISTTKLINTIIINYLEGELQE